MSRGGGCSAWGTKMVSSEHACVATFLVVAIVKGETMKRLAKIIGFLLLVLFVGYVLLRQPWKGAGKLSELPTTVYQGFHSPQEVKLEGYDGHCMEPFISRDGQYLFWNNLNHSSVNTNLFFARRQSGPLHFKFGGEVAGVNTKKLDGVASMTAAGELFYTSLKSYKPKVGHYGTLFHGPFADGKVERAKKVSGRVDQDKFGWLNMDCEITACGTEMYISSAWFQMYRPPPRKSNILRALRQKGGSYELVDDDEIMKNINTSCLEYAPCTSVDRLELFFSRTYIPSWFGKNKGKTQLLICRAVRASVDEPFGEVQLVGAIHQEVADRQGSSSGKGDGRSVGNSSAARLEKEVGKELVAGGLSADKMFVEAPSLSGDGRYLYYHKRVGKTFRIWCVTRKSVGD